MASSFGLGQPGPVQRQVPGEVVADRARRPGRPSRAARCAVGGGAEVAHLPVAVQERERGAAQCDDERVEVAAQPFDEIDDVSRRAR